MPATAETDLSDPARDAIRPDGIHVLDGSCVIEVGELRVNVTNHGLIGSQYSAAYTYSHAPSGEWPGGSGNEYLWGAGLWIGGRVGGTLSVTTSLPERELRPSTDLHSTMYESRDGFVVRPFPSDLQSGVRLPDGGADDDGDGAFDEETLNGIDDDRDGRVDEDFGQFGDQMFSCTMYDGLPLIRELYPEHRPLGVRVTQQVCGWDQGDISNAVGVDYTIANVGHHRIEDMYLGMYVDCDIQSRTAGEVRPDDLGGLFSGIIRAENNLFYRIEMGYMWDGDEEDPLPGRFGVLLVDHDTAFDGITRPHVPKIKSFELFSTQAAVNQDGEPQSDPDRYYLMQYGHRDRTTRESEAGDYKYMFSCGPFDPVEIGDEIHFQVALVAGRGMQGLLANAAEAARVGAGQFVNADGDWSTGHGGRETLVCLGDFPSVFGNDPILGRRYNFMDEFCAGSYPIMFQNIVREEDLWEYPDGRLCTWVNMDNCTECLRANGVECTPEIFHSSGRWLTGTGGRETQYHWSVDSPSPPLAPNSRVQPGDRSVEIFWDDRSEWDPDPYYGIVDFESYRVWRVADWVPPGDLPEDTTPPMSAWGMIAEYDLINEIPAGIGGFPNPRRLGRNTGLEIAAYEPACLRDERFAGLAGSMQALVDSDPEGLLYSFPPIRASGGAIAEGMEAFAKWETHPDVLDTFFAVTARAADPAAGVVGKRATRYYHHIDTGLQNGFRCYYAVVARDHALTWFGDPGFVASGLGIEADPDRHCHRTMARTDAQTAAERAANGTNIYVVPNPATRESLAEFQSRAPSGPDPTGVRVMFNNLPLAHNTIRIFTTAGDLLETIEHDGFDQGGAASWNLVTRNGQEIVSGVYLYSVHSDEDGFEPFRGKFVVIR